MAEQETRKNNGGGGLWARAEARGRLLRNELASWLVDDVIELICDWCKAEVVVAVHTDNKRIKIGYFDADSKKWVQEGWKPTAEAQDGERGQLFGGMVKEVQSTSTAKNTSDYQLLVSGGQTWDEQKRPLTDVFDLKTQTWQQQVVGARPLKWARTHWHSMQGDDRRAAWAVSSTRIPSMDDQQLIGEEEELEIDYVAFHRWNTTTRDWARVGRALDVGLYWMAVEHSGVVYCIEGAHGKNPEMDDEIALARLDVQSGNWLQSSPLVPTARCNTGVAALDGFVYVIGGRAMYTAVPVKTTERYDPSTNTWLTCKDMHDPKTWPLAVAVEGRIFVLGQDCDYGPPPRSPDVYNKLAEWYCPTTDTWEIAYELRKPPPHNVFLTTTCL